MRIMERIGGKDFLARAISESSRVGNKGSRILSIALLRSDGSDDGRS